DGAQPSGQLFRTPRDGLRDGPPARFRIKIFCNYHVTKFYGVFAGNDVTQSALVLKNRTYDAPGVHVPEANGPVPATRHEALGIDEGRPHDVSFVDQRSAGAFKGREVPELHRLVAQRRTGPAVRADGHCLQAGAGGHVPGRVSFLAALLDVPD